MEDKNTKKLNKLKSDLFVEIPPNYSCRYDVKTITTDDLSRVMQIPALRLFIERGTSVSKLILFYAI